MRLWNSSGKGIGSLHLHNEVSLSRFPETVTEGELGLPVELVAVYKATEYSKTRLYDEKRQHRGGPYSFLGLALKREEDYTVLWIE